MLLCYWFYLLNHYFRHQNSSFITWKTTQKLFKKKILISKLILSHHVRCLFVCSQFWYLELCWPSNLLFDHCVENIFPTVQCFYPLWSVCAMLGFIPFCEWRSSLNHHPSATFTKIRMREDVAAISKKPRLSGSFVWKCNILIR